MAVQPVPMKDADHIYEQAKLIRDMCERIMDACSHKQRIDPLARNKATGGALAQDAAVLGIMIVQHEYEQQQ